MKLRSPPSLAGTIFSEQEKESARQNYKLLFVSLMTDPVCNLACPDCYVGEKKLTGTELILDERKYVLDQAAELGAKTLRIAGAGEPLCDNTFWSTVDYAMNELDMNVFFFTNGTIIDRTIAEKIADYDKLTAVLKFSGSPFVMEKLTGNKGCFSKENFVEQDGILIPKYLECMLDVGMNALDKNGNSRLGIEFLLRKLNYGYCSDIF